MQDMNELARRLQETIDSLMFSNGWNPVDHSDIVCAMEAVAQRAMQHHYGDDGIRYFNVLVDEDDALNSL